jgi:hypothetical protein
VGAEEGVDAGELGARNLNHVSHFVCRLVVCSRVSWGAGQTRPPPIQFFRASGPPPKNQFQRATLAN